MIIETPIEENSVVTVKLTTGEELLAYFVSENAEQLVVRKPLSITADAQGQLGLSPIVISSDYIKDNKKIKFSKHVVIMVTKSNSQFENAYVQQASGIVSPTV